MAKQTVPSQLLIEVSERLPYYVQGPCALNCKVSVERARDYYVLRLTSTGQLTINCQRCLHDFNFDYNHSSEIAICDSDEVANQLMKSRDCVVHADDDLDLLDIVTDDLHLFSPEKHEEC